MRCSNQFNCKGHYTLHRHESFCGLWEGRECNCEVRDRVWVGAMRLTIWAQCSECGVAPTEQGMIVHRVLTEVSGILNLAGG